MQTLGFSVEMYLSLPLEKCNLACCLLIYCMSRDFNYHRVKLLHLHAQTVGAQAKPMNLRCQSASPRRKSSIKDRSQQANQEVSSQSRESASSTHVDPKASETEAEVNSPNPKDSLSKETTKKTERNKTSVHQQEVENKTKKGERARKMKMMKNVIGGGVAVHVAS